MQKLLEVMAQLRDPENGCPWDVAQSFASVAPYTIEEAYEVADAIARDDMADLEDELGDLLLQVVFHARMAEEAGHFDFDSVAATIAGKLIRRHPHVFGSAEERAVGMTKGSWERLKAAERERREGAHDPSALGGIATALPALKRAQKLGKRAASVGFDWPDRRGVRAKIQEELDEIEEAAGRRDRTAVEAEIGDLLFSVVNLARHLDVDPEHALLVANYRFEARFREMERAVVGAGRSLDALSLDAMEQEWQGAKLRLGS